MPAYMTKYRPVGHATVPKGCKWSWLALPFDHTRPDMFPGVPYSSHRFGVFTTETPLTDAELEAYEIERIDVGF
jgi:hypothetical protein